MITIPPGWRRLRPDERIIKGDKFLGEGGWMNCVASVGETVAEAFLPDEPAIRKGEPAPPVEKEWLNPWD
jgi:hypothetical protein